MALRFVWDARKDTLNRRKHQVGFPEAVSVFSDPLALVFDDAAHSLGERREIIIGHSSKPPCCWWSSPNGTATRFVSLVRGQPLPENVMTTKKAARPSRRVPAMKTEYRFDYSKARPNPYAERMSGQTQAVVLDQDVSKVFQSADQVNHALRTLMQALPKARTAR